MSDIVAFLQARLDEDEAIGRKDGLILMDDSGSSLLYVWSDEVIINAARVLREVEAKRRIIASANDWPYGAGDPENVESGWRDHADVTLRLLAFPYFDHPDYDPAWAVEQ